jgi:hypothetical protein
MLTFAYTVAAPPPLEVKITSDAGSTATVDLIDPVPFTIALNQSARLAVEHIVVDTGKTNSIGRSAPGESGALYEKGSHKLPWHRVNMEEFTLYDSGAHRIRVTATTLDGTSKTVLSDPVTLKPAPKPAPAATAATPKTATPQRAAPKLTLELTPDHVLIGGRMVVGIKYSFDQDSMVKLTVLDKRGKVIKTLRDSLRTEDSSHVKKGSYTRQLDVEDYDYGNYKVVLEATNFYGTRTASQTFSVTWR